MRSRDEVQRRSQPLRRGEGRAAQATCGPDASRDCNSTALPSVQYSHHGLPFSFPLPCRVSPAGPTVSYSRLSYKLPRRRSLLGRSATNLL